MKDLQLGILKREVTKTHSLSDPTIPLVVNKEKEKGKQKDQKRKIKDRDTASSDDDDEGHAKVSKSQHKIQKGNAKEDDIKHNPSASKSLPSFSPVSLGTLNSSTMKKAEEHDQEEELRNHAKMLELLNRIKKENNGEIEFLVDDDVNESNIGAEIDSGAYGRVSYFRKNEGHMGDFVIKIFNSRTDMSIEEIYCLWLLRKSEKIARLISIVEERADDGHNSILGVNGYVLPRYDQTLRVFSSNKKATRRDKTQVEDAKQIFKLLCDVAEGINEMHNKHIAHLDLCDMNIMVHFSNDPTVLPTAKIIDFGSARFFDCDEALWCTRSKEEEGMLSVPEGFDLSRDKLMRGILNKKAQGKFIKIVSDFGHVTYRSPESFVDVRKKEKYIDPTKVDTWAYGVLIYELLLGKSAWSGYFDRGQLKGIVSTQNLVWKYIKDLPRTWQVLLHGCWKVEPEDRWGAQRVLNFLTNNTINLLDEVEILYGNV